MKNNIRIILCILLILGLAIGMADTAFGYSYKYVKNGKTTQSALRCYNVYSCSGHYGYCYVKRICYYL